MTKTRDDLLATRLSLLGRLKDWKDQVSWQEFFDTYGRLIHSVARETGLDDAAAQDVVQETVVAVAQGIGDFRANPKRGSFKRWLCQITRRHIADHYERRAQQERLAGRLPPAVGVKSTPEPVEDATRTATLERVPDPDTLNLDRHWEEHWRKHLFAAAAGRVKARVSTKQFQIFELYVLREWPVAKVARTLGVSVARVYLTKHRVGTLLRKETRRLERDGIG